MITSFSELKKTNTLLFPTPLQAGKEVEILFIW